jgi:D-xylose transport system substrate-binding protein
MHKAISAIGPAGFAGVYAETDSIATGVVAAMEAAGIDPASKPTTGRAATLVGLRRILIGEQYMTVYEPAEREATVAAEVAVELAQGNGVPRARLNGKVSNYTTQVPAILLPGVAVTKRNLDRAVVADGVVRASVLCAGHDRSACARAGITW